MAVKSPQLRDKVAPDIVNAVFAAGLTSPYRLLCTMRAIDVQGRGMYYVPELVERFATNAYGTCLWTKKHLMVLLRKGTGIFWTLDDNTRNGQTKVSIHAPDRIALALGVESLVYDRVFINLEDVLYSLTHFRAVLHTAFESSRKSDTPIARSTLAEITHVSPRTQQCYDQSIDRQRIRNIVDTGLLWTEENIQEVHWKHVERNGRSRPIRPIRQTDGTKTIGYETASTREKVLERTPRGRQKKLNRRLRIMRQQPAAREAQTGTARAHVLVVKRPRWDAQSRNQRKVYYEDAKSALKAFERGQDREICYFDRTIVTYDAGRPSRITGMHLWRSLSL